MTNISKSETFSSVEAVNRIENAVFNFLKPMGFKKYGRTLHRFTDGDISQVINFQNGCPQKDVYNILWINIGIRVPECTERTFFISSQLKKYYREYDCNMQTRLGYIADGTDSYYDTNKNPAEISEDIIKKLRIHVIPVFEILSSRDNILKYRRNYPNFDSCNNEHILLDEAMIWGRKGDLKKAESLFNQYFQQELETNLQLINLGKKIYLIKGDKISYFNEKSNRTETVTGNNSGYVTLYCWNKGHLSYLKDLAQKLGMTLYNIK